MPKGVGYNNDKGMMGDKAMLDGSRNAKRPINPNGRIDPGETPMMRQTKTMTNSRRMDREMVPKGSQTIV